MSIPIYIIDAFTDRRFGGNPAAVCLLEEPLEDVHMQQVAAEMNLSETAFLLKEKSGWRLRWFTPRAEVELCGHATLAVAHVMRETWLLNPGETTRFFTRSGVLSATRKNGWITLDFPAQPITPTKAPQEVLQALGITTPRFVGDNSWTYLIEVDEEATVHGLQPDIPRLASVTTHGIIVTALSVSADYDFVSRFFAPAIGVPEDPVTGAAHCALAPFWGEILGKSVMTGYQASPRGGQVKVELVEDRVLLSGQAVTVVKGELL